ncbi:hypothetical protein H6G27_04445 [Nostoc linckia FACHB-104]|nr:hypothetical protein [Nostoc linckia FACHB-104]
MAIADVRLWKVARTQDEIKAGQGEISFVGRKVLDTFGESLGLHPEEISAIETEVLQPYREYKKKLQQYEQVLVEVVQQEPILSENTRSQLKKLQQILGLGDEDIAPIAARIIPQQEQTKPVAEEQTVNPQSPAKSEDVSSPQQQYSNTFNISDSNITALSGSGQINYYEAPKKPGN